MNEHSPDLVEAHSHQGPLLPLGHDTQSRRRTEWKMRGPLPALSVRATTDGLQMVPVDMILQTAG